MFFNKLENEKVKVKNSLGYMELDVYTDDEQKLYAKNGKYYIILMIGGVTSNSKISWTQVSVQYIIKNSVLYKG